MVVRRPPPALAPFVESIWYFAGDLAHTRERILPTGAMQILVNLHEDELRTYHGPAYDQVVRSRGAVLGGAHDDHFAIDTAEQRRIVGVSFKPGGAYPFFAPPSDAIGAAHVELDALWGRDGAVLRERLLEAPTPAAALRTLEAVLLARAVRPLERDPALAYALDALDGPARIGDVTDRLGMSPKRFLRRFSAEVGLTPKRFARVRRFRRVLGAVERGRAVEWAQVALDCGYFDQAHMIHDFRAFSGINPTAYRPRTPGELSHVPLSDSAG